MNDQNIFTGLQLRSHLFPSGELVISLVDVDTLAPAADEVVVRVEATPINPSDIGLLFGAAEISTAKATGTASRAAISCRVSAAGMKSMDGRMDQSLPVGNEGAGMAVAAGTSPEAQALLGKTVSMLGGAMYAQYRNIKTDQCLLLPEGTTANEGASSFVNPLTALGMVETMRREGHAALVHTAAASNLGQMLNHLCIQDGIALVNIVRKPEQVALLKGMGARYVCDSSAATFMVDLTAALASTGATVAFDATGGGKLAGNILSCMEAALSRTATLYSRYGTNIHKQVYLYGGLDPSPTEFNRNFGFAWGMGGWLLFPFLQKIGPEATQRLRQRVANEIRTTFASHYSKEISLLEALQPAHVAAYALRATGTKYLINPNRGF